LAILVASAISGCASRPDTPTAPSVAPGPLAVGSAGGGSAGVSGQFYPLQVGNHWSYHKRLSYTLVEGDRLPSPSYDWNATVDRGLTCFETIDGRDYVVEEVEERAQSEAIFSWVRYRQDRTGLYEADVELQVPAQCFGPIKSSSSSAPMAAERLARGIESLVAASPPERQAAYRAAGERLREKLARVERALRRGATGAPSHPELAQPGELTRLSYPLYPAKSWTIRRDPEGATFMARVEGTDLLNLPAGRFPGFRIRILSTFLGPDDEVRTWYGPSGYLQLVAHMETFAVDDRGAIIGRLAIDQRETLVSLSLVSRWSSGGLFEGNLPGRH
jgi:hypothetical protein